MVSAVELVTEKRDESGARDGESRSRLGALPPRPVLEALLGDAEKRFNAPRTLLIISWASATLALIAIGFALHAARPVVVPFMTAFVLSLLLAPAADWLGRRGAPEALRAALVVIAAFVALAAAFYFTARPAAEFAERLPAVIDDARYKLADLTHAVTRVEEVSEQVSELTEGNRLPAQEVVLRNGSFAAGLAARARDALIVVVFTTVLVYFLLATRSDFRLKAIAARRTLAGKLQTGRILRDMQRNVGSYMFTMLLINTGLGAVVAFGMAAIGMPSPLVWGLLAGVLNFVPYIGPAAVTILLGVTGVVTYDTVIMMAAPALIYIAANFLESNIVTPALVGVRLRISPLAILVSIALFTWLWGPIGAVLAIPLVIVFKTICDAVRPLQPIGVLLGEVQIVRGRKVGFCRIDTVAARAPRAPVPTPPRRRRPRWATF